MEEKKPVEISSSQIQEENQSDPQFQPKPKIDWSFLSDIETLITEMNQGKKVRCIVFDTETTGLNYKKDHILELAAVEVENFKLTGQVFHIYIKPRVFVPKNVQEINHIKYDDYKNFWEYYNQNTKSQLEKFLEFIGNDSYLIAHNATFDYYFLINELKYWGIIYNIPRERFRCTLRIVKQLFKEKGIETPNHKLITVCDYFKILVNPNEGSFHNGLFDTIMTSKLLIHLYKNYLNINDYVVPDKFVNKKNKEDEQKEKKDMNNYNNDINKKNKIENNNINKEENDQNNDNIIQQQKNKNELNLLIQKMNEMNINKQQSKENNGQK